jgi:hypothetical protein
MALLALVISIEVIGCGGGGGAAAASGPLNCKITVTGDAESGLGTFSYESTETVPYDPSNVALAASTGTDAKTAGSSILCMHTDKSDGATAQVTWNVVLAGPVTPLTASETTNNYQFFNVAYDSPSGGYVCGKVVKGNGQMDVSGTYALTVASSSAYGPAAATRYAIKASGHAVCPGPKGTVAIDVMFY